MICALLPWFARWWTRRANEARRTDVVWHLMSGFAFKDGKPMQGDRPIQQTLAA
jgi:hypothetical protein